MRFLRFTKPVAGKVEGLGELNAADAEYPQFDNLAEVIASGGDELSNTEREVLQNLKAPKTLGYVNSKVRGSAKQSITNAINSGDKALGAEKILGDARAAGHDWSIANARSRGTGATAKAAAFDDVMARVRRGETVSQDELATLAAQFGA